MSTVTLSRMEEKRPRTPFTETNCEVLRGFVVIMWVSMKAAVIFTPSRVTVAGTSTMRFWVRCSVRE